jgi:hypothetical protein
MATEQIVVTSRVDPVVAAKLDRGWRVRASERAAPKCAVTSAGTSRGSLTATTTRRKPVIYEDSSWEGWTMAVPTGSKVVEQPLGAFDDDGLYATPERLVVARETWPEASSEDYEQIGRRRFREVATGID